MVPRHRPGQGALTAGMNRVDPMLSDDGHRFRCDRIEPVQINILSGIWYVRCIQGGARQDILKRQIKETTHAHFEKEWQFKDKGIKILSLFFIDRVDNYRKYADTCPTCVTVEKKENSTSEDCNGLKIEQL